MYDATRTDTSWVGLYHGNFQNELKGKKILELGCGDCANAAVMAAFGAEVYANDISQKPGEIINKLNTSHKFEFEIKFIKGDFLKADIKNNFYDIVIGKAFVHHLTHDQEVKFTKKIVSILKANGLVRYFEPAINNKFLDHLRWLTPVPGRPSKFQRRKFEQWRINDPHPERDNSSKHYEKIGKKYFEETRIVPIGTIERFHRILPKKYSRRFRRFAFKFERKLPKSINLSLTRSHLIEYKIPKKQKGT
ncbi:MAG: class I SAM-dependent methyltransferase [Algibacter sp.]|uniref:class I SAM-dependent methyltransferase n=1 Tax=Algibacter sp. TaxID=1872428 RepID=UPI00262E7F52|nr:class I SAM-dependent methyltransferase [Algibacter sp.]MDG1728675.1 class I SAM-dependent methyltransferase [Algibacter sp.]MDG2177319.1 class I SAM-dependent methyltransferase [Algibacter sp.]